MGIEQDDDMAERGRSSTFKSPRVVLSQRQIGIVFGGLMLGSFLSSLDQTVVATALPTIVRDLGTASELSWVVTSFNEPRAYAASSP